MNKTIFPLKKPIKNIFFLGDKDGDIKHLIDIDTWYVRVKKNGRDRTEAVRDGLNLATTLLGFLNC